MCDDKKQSHIYIYIYIIPPLKEKKKEGEEGAVQAETYKFDANFIKGISSLSSFYGSPCHSEGRHSKKNKQQVVNPHSDERCDIITPSVRCIDTAVLCRP